MNWSQFRAAAPTLAAHAERLFEGPEVLYIGTIRRDGSPRISPCEFVLHADDLYLGMMTGSLKALDLERDPRCTLHSVVADKNASAGEFKLHGRARAVTDAGERERYIEALRAHVEWDPGEVTFPLFAIQVESAAYFMAEGDHRGVIRWRAGEPERHYRQGFEATLIPV